MGVWVTSYLSANTEIPTPWMWLHELGSIQTYWVKMSLLVWSTMTGDCPSRKHGMDGCMLAHTCVQYHNTKTELYMLYLSINQGLPKLIWKPPEAGGKSWNKQVLSEFSEGDHTTSLRDFKPPECWETTWLCCWVIQLEVLLWQPKDKTTAIYFMPQDTLLWNSWPLAMASGSLVFHRQTSLIDWAKKAGWNLGKERERVTVLERRARAIQEGRHKTILDVSCKATTQAIKRDYLTKCRTPWSRLPYPCKVCTTLSIPSWKSLLPHAPEVPELGVCVCFTTALLLDLRHCTTVQIGGFC